MRAVIREICKFLIEGKNVVIDDENLCFTKTRASYCNSVKEKLANSGFSVRFVCYSLEPMGSCALGAIHSDV